ncbi:enoyl-ACP reductase FabI [Rhodomicrobium udaipurense]|uniref:enoyl-[acyl-carrier-protein] reductase (NADH) n=2 Tax=Hyphomicrobiaceae TaxID=45401 RepID=A0A8I1KJ31_9HYPH|nr:enoyl-ACP reductase FabI [Rhodomicrobium udaipurense]
MRETIFKDFIGSLAEKMGEPIDARFAAITVFLSGLGIIRNVLQIRLLAEGEGGDLEAIIARAIMAMLATPESQAPQTPAHQATACECPQTAHQKAEQAKVQGRTRKERVQTRKGIAMTAIVDLNGKRGLVIGIANENSIAAGCAAAFHQAGAELAVTYLNDKALRFVSPVAEAVRAKIMLPCDVRVPGELEAVFETIARQWGQLDFVLHSIAFAPREDLQTSIVNCSAEGFALAMDISCHSFIRVAKLAMPLMTDGGSLLTVTFYGSERVVQHYNLMGPVKAALESTVRYIAADLADKRIRANAISAGPVKTRAASGIGRFDELLDEVRDRTPGHHLISVEDVGRVAAFLASEAGSSTNGSVVFADNGFHTVA